MTLKQMLMLRVCCVQGIVVSLLGHMIGTPNSYSERPDNKMGRGDRLAENTWRTLGI